MRFKYTIVALLIAFVGTTTLSVAGQEEPLPAIQAKGSLKPFTPSIALAIEPDRVYTWPLVDALRANNYLAFDALYQDALRRGQSVAAFAALHELWTYGVTDPMGSFYGIEKYEHFAHMYPGYTSYIDRYRIIDSKGNVFYPTGETRTFLLDRALDDLAPREQVTESHRTTQSEQQSSVATETPASAIAAEQSPIVAERPPAVIAAKPPVVARIPITEAPVVVQAEPQTSDAPSPVPQPIATNNDFGSRGIFLLLIGIVGIGILAMMLRAPRELPPSIMTPQALPSIVPPPGDKASAPVEPIRRPAAAPPPPPSGKNRAGGSHG